MGISLKLAVKRMTGQPAKYIFQCMLLFIFLLITYLSVLMYGGAKKGMDTAYAGYGNEVRLLPAFSAAPGNGQNIAKASFVSNALGSRLIDSKDISGYNFNLTLPVRTDLKNVPYQINQMVAKSKSKGSDEVFTVFYLIGNSIPQLQEEFRSGKLKLEKGSFYKKAYGRNTAVISAELARENRLELGSTLTVYSFDLSQEQKLTIVGTYEKTGEKDENSSLRNIYVPLEAAQKFYSRQNKDIPEDMLTYASYYLKSPKSLDGLKMEARKKGMDMDKFRFIENSTDYNLRVEKLINLKTVSMYGILVGTVFSVGFMFFYGMTGCKQRKKEILSMVDMGFSSRHILIQLCTEVLIVFAGAAGMAVIAGRMAAGGVSDIFLNNFMTVIQQMSSVYIAEAGDPLAAVKPELLVSTGPTEMQEIISRIHPSVGGTEAVIVIVMVVIIIFAGVYPMVRRFGSYFKEYTGTGLAENVKAAFTGGKAYAVIGRMSEEKKTLLRQTAPGIRLDGYRPQPVDTDSLNSRAVLLFKDTLFLPYLTAGEYVAVSMELSRSAKGENTPKRAVEFLSEAGFDLSKRKYKMSRLSPELQQKAILAGLRARKAPFVVFEEGAWGEDGTEEMFIGKLFEAAHHRNSCIVIAANSPETALRADGVWGIKDGILLPIRI